MDSRFALIGVPMAKAVMEKQRKGSSHSRAETPPYWPSANHVQPQHLPAPQRVSAWCALPGIAAMWRLFAVI